MLDRPSLLAKAAIRLTGNHGRPTGKGFQSAWDMCRLLARVKVRLTGTTGRPQGQASSLRQEWPARQESG
jgi:hypothetical protein